MAQLNSHEILAKVEPLLARLAEAEGPVVLMTCGLAGSGKSTFSKSVLARWPHFKRLSIDEIIGTKHGLYGLDYPADEQIYREYLQEADGIYLHEFKQLLKAGSHMILDRSFYAKEDRDEFLGMIEAAGAKRLMVYFKATDKEALWLRICARSAKPKDANSAFDISRDTFEMYWSGFEEPVGEDEIVLSTI